LGGKQPLVGDPGFLRHLLISSNSEYQPFLVIMDFRLNWTNRSLLLILVAHGVHAATLKEIERRVIYTVDDRTSAPHNQVHFPQLYEAEDGVWYMVLREGPHYSGARVFGIEWDDPRAVYLTDDRPQTVRSDDRGRTWKGWSGMPFRSRDLRFFVTRLSDGTLISYPGRFGEIVANPDGTSANSTVDIMRSVDEGATWTKESPTVTGLPDFRTGASACMWGSIIEVPTDTSSRQLVTYYGSEGGEGPGRAVRYKMGILESTDGGRSWQALSLVAGSDTAGEEGPNEADLVDLGGDELLTVFRTGDKPGSVMLQSRSLDGGRTWDPPKAVPGGEEGVSPQLDMLGNGLTLLCYGTRVEKNRSLWARVSADGGRQWEEPFRIFKGIGKVYANVQLLDDDTFRVVYDESPAERPDGTIYNAIVRVVIRVND
jgi:hypothetical protein